MNRENQLDRQYPAYDDGSFLRGLIYDQNRSFPQITFRVRTYDPVDLALNAAPGVDKDAQLKQILEQTVWVEFWPYPLKNGDTFTLYGKEALTVYHALEEWKQLEVIYYGIPFQPTPNPTPNPTIPSNFRSIAWNYGKATAFNTSSNFSITFFSESRESNFKKIKLYSNRGNIFPKITWSLSYFIDVDRDEIRQISETIAGKNIVCVQLSEDLFEYTFSFEILSAALDESFYDGGGPSNEYTLTTIGGILPGEWLVTDQNVYDTNTGLGFWKTNPKQLPDLNNNYMIFDLVTEVPSATALPTPTPTINPNGLVVVSVTNFNIDSIAPAQNGYSFYNNPVTNQPLFLEFSMVEPIPSWTQVVFTNNSSQIITVNIAGVIFNVLPGQTFAQTVLLNPGDTVTITGPTANYPANAITGTIEVLMLPTPTPTLAPNACILILSNNTTDGIYEQNCPAIIPTGTPAPTITPTVTLTPSPTPTPPPTSTTMPGTPTATPNPTGLFFPTPTPQPTLSVSCVRNWSYIYVYADGNGDSIYTFMGDSTFDLTKKYYVNVGTYYLQLSNVTPSFGAIAFLNFGRTDEIEYSGTDLAGNFMGPDGHNYDFYYGTITLTVKKSFTTPLSVANRDGTYWGGQNLLLFSSNCVEPAGAYVWGDNTFGNLALGDTNNRSSPVLYPYNDMNWWRFDIGKYYTVHEIRVDPFTKNSTTPDSYTYQIWGVGYDEYNNTGSFAPYVTANKSSPVQMYDSLWSSNWQGSYWQFVTTQKNNASYSSAENPYLFGDNTFSQTTTNAYFPTRAPYNPIRIKDIGLSDNTGMAIQTIGRLHARGKYTNTLWGSTHTDIVSGKTDTWNLIGNISDYDINYWYTVEQDGYFSVALKKDGTIWSTGMNGYGNLGHNNTTTISSWTQIGIGITWRSIDMKEKSVIATNAAGQVFVWGNNNNGILGLGDTVHRSSPTLLPVTDWKKVGLGFVLKNDGTLWVWGSNDKGQLANLTTSHAYSPVQTALADNKWVDIYNGYHFYYGIRKT
jgi:hypothetical protein